MLLSEKSQVFKQTSIDNNRYHSEAFGQPKFQDKQLAHHRITHPMSVLFSLFHVKRDRISGECAHIQKQPDQTLLSEKTLDSFHIIIRRQQPLPF